MTVERIEVSELGDKGDAWVTVTDSDGVSFACLARDLLQAAQLLSESLLTGAEHGPCQSLVIVAPAP